MSTEDAFSQIFFHTRTIYQVIISHIQNPSLAQKHIKKECGWFFSIASAKHICVD